MIFTRKKFHETKINIKKTVAVVTILLLLVYIVSFAAYFNLVFKKFYIDSVQYEQNSIKNHLESIQTTVPKLSIQILSNTTVTNVLSAKKSDSSTTKKAIEFIKNINFYNDISQIIICDPKNDVMWQDTFMKKTAISDHLSQQQGVDQLITAFYQGKNYIPVSDNDTDDHYIAYLHQDYRGYIMIYKFPQTNYINKLKNNFADKNSDSWVYYKNEHLVVSDAALNIKATPDMLRLFEKEPSHFTYKNRLYIRSVSGNLQCITAVPYWNILLKGIKNSSFLILPVLIIGLLAFFGFLWFSYLYQKTTKRHLRTIDIVTEDIEFFRLKQIIIKLFNGKSADKEDFQRLQKNFSNPFSRIFTIQLDPPDDIPNRTNSDDVSLIKYGICNISCELANQIGACLSFDIDDDIAILILNTQTPITEDVILQLIQKIKSLSSEIYSLTITVTLSNHIEAVEDLASGITNISELSNYRYMTGHNSIITPTNTSTVNFGEKMPQIYYTQLVDAVNQKDFPTIAKLLQEFRILASDCTPVSVRNQLLQIFLYTFQNTKGIGLTSRNYETLLSFPVFEEAMNFFENLLLNQSEISTSEELDFAELVKNLTAENYSNPDYNIGYLADKLQISISYAGKRFKSLFGCSFNSYLMEYRIEMAAGMLKNTNIKIGEIASKCGFNSDSYFVTSFKKLKNITPQGYRDKTN